MKSRTLYTLVNLLGLAAAFGAVVMLGLALFGSIVERRFRTDLFGAAFVLFSAAVALHALWDIGTRLMRVEEAQRRSMSDVERMRDAHRA
jgi:hypothetical protein